MENPAMFEGWAIVELMGHSRELGYVHTLYFGNQAMFEVAGPALPEREVIVVDGFYSDALKEYIPCGSKILKSSVNATSRLVSSSAIYAINPSDEDTIISMIGGNGPVKGIIDIPEEAKKNDNYPF